MTRLTFTLGACLWLVGSAMPAAENWPRLRGPDSLGVEEGDAKGLPDTWTTTENVRWKTDLPGRGWSSPIVWGNRIYLTTVVNQEESEAPKKGLYFGGDRPKPPAAPHQWKVYCLDLDRGGVLWERLAHEGVPESSIHLKNSFASETPVTDGQRVYAMFGNLGLFCYDMDGRELWTYKWAPHKTRFGWGTAASPVLYQDRLFVVNDNEEWARNASFSIGVSGLDALYREYRTIPANVGPLEEKPWGRQEFHVIVPSVISNFRRSVLCRL